MNVIARIADLLAFFLQGLGKFPPDSSEEAWRLSLIDPEKIEERIRLLSQRMW